MPLSIKRAFFPALPGAIVMITDSGEVKCCYLGTEPELFTAPPLPPSELDFDQAQEELERLEKIIKIENDTNGSQQFEESFRNHKFIVYSFFIFRNEPHFESL